MESFGQTGNLRIVLTAEKDSPDPFSRDDHAQLFGVTSIRVARREG
jgi:hypothetical protein